MGQSIQERTELILWKLAFKKFQGIWSASQIVTTEVAIIELNEP